MKHIKSYTIFESISEEEMDRILDKINRLGINSLSEDELNNLKSLKDGFRDDSDNVSFDKDGNILVNGKSPLYKNVEDTKKSDVPKDTNIQKDKKLVITNNYDILLDKYNKSNIILLKNDDDILVGLDKYLQGVSRVYFISFKKIKDTRSRSKCLKLVYNLNTSSNQNFNLFDNYNNQIDFNKLQFFLKENGITYDVFNHAFYYVEENFINR